MKVKNSRNRKNGFSLNEIKSPCVMGIINATPDSFYRESRVESIRSVLEKAEKMITDGAVILDIGGQSTRPDASLVSAEEEIKRVVPVIGAIRKMNEIVPISIDTFYSEVAKAALDAGADMVNDISAGEDDKEMFGTIAERGVPYIMMHKKGTPQTMKQNADYKDVTKEVLEYLIQRVKLALEAGIPDIAIDPGFGFSKSLTDNYELLKNLKVFSSIDLPILVGISRKSMIWKPLGITAETALSATQAAHMAALMNGAAILRVHDVKETVETVKLFELMGY